jgi:hypothetical protein
MTPDAIRIFDDLVTLANSQRLNREKVAAGGHGAGVAQAELRRVAHEIRLKAEHFRALTSPSLKAEEVAAVNVEHERRWARRKGVSG